jgi:hypothetical protein
MSRSLHIIDSRKDAAHGWQRLEHYQFAAHDNFAPLLHSEIQSVLPYYPIAFVKNAADKRFHLVVVQGLHDRDNLYVNRQGLWLVSYIPCVYRGYPFVLHKVTGAQGTLQGALAFNMDSGLFRENPGQHPHEERFFDDQGEPRPLLKKLMNFLQGTTRDRIVTENAVYALDEAGLLQPWSLKIDNPDSKRPLLDGLYCIDPKKFNALDGGTLKSLHDAGALMIAYAHLFSLSQITLLRKLYQLKYSAQQPVGDSKELQSIDEIFGEAPKDELKFDWNNL